MNTSVHKDAGLPTNPTTLLQNLPQPQHHPHAAGYGHTAIRVRQPVAVGHQPGGRHHQGMGQGRQAEAVQAGPDSPGGAAGIPGASRLPNTTQALWLGKAGRPLKSAGMQIMVRRLAMLGGNARWSPHTFRNTFALNYLRAGGDPFTLQILGGWEDLEMPRHYCAALKAEDAFAVHRRASPADPPLAGNSRQQRPATQGKRRSCEGPQG